ncbi:MAG: dihydropteroate synthase [Anaerolineales bacterium]|nr:dihydropteroate synthase [Anaerolineales bacterium]
MTTVLQGTGEPIEITPTDATRIIGERINPSGKSKLRQALLDREWEYITNEARRQVEAGAQVIDVNVGGKGIDETELLPEAVRVVAEAVDLPLSIDTRVPAALEAALKICPGRPLVNSIGGEQKILAENLPIIASFNIPVIALCMGQEGIPDNAEARLKIAHQVLDAAVKAGLKEEDILFDPLVMTVGADDRAALVAFDTIQLLRKEFPKNNITGGASNVSFGMPDRDTINASFLTTAAVLGMNIPITDPTNRHLLEAIFLADVFRGCDRKKRSYMQFIRQNLPVINA